jgi:hypothetical protein
MGREAFGRWRSASGFALRATPRQVALGWRLGKDGRWEAGKVGGGEAGRLKAEREAFGGWRQKRMKLKVEG